MKGGSILYQYKFPYDSNIRYLPLVYFLPEEMFVRCPTLRQFSRCFGEVAKSERQIDLIKTDGFFGDILDATAALAFPHFGFGGWKEHYTGNSPIWKLSYALPDWARLLESEIGWGLQALFNVPSTAYIPFMSAEYVKKVFGQIVKRYVAEENLQPVFDVIKQMPCDEYFEKWNTNVRKDFLRKWYHTRSKRVKMVSLEALQEDEHGGVYENVADNTNIAEDVSAGDFARRFKKSLSMRDMEILELRVVGLTYQEIADKLGYKNHSGVVKRMQAIKKSFVEYEEKYG